MNDFSYGEREIEYDGKPIEDIEIDARNDRVSFKHPHFGLVYTNADEFETLYEFLIKAKKEGFTIDERETDMGMELTVYYWENPERLHEWIDKDEYFNRLEIL